MNAIHAAFMFAVQLEQRLNRWCLPDMVSELFVLGALFQEPRFFLGLGVGLDFLRPALASNYPKYAQICLVVCYLFKSEVYLASTPLPDQGGTLG